MEANLNLKIKDVQFKYLDAEDIANPLSVICEFFSADWLNGHLEHLYKWRKHVTDVGYYKDENGNPSSLLYTHQLTVRLIEATYVLSKTSNIIRLAKNIPVNFESQLEQERREWLEYPRFLKPVEQANPYKIIVTFFERYSLEQYLYDLYDWLGKALSTHAVDESLRASEIIYVYENLQLLYEAVWVIRQRELEPVITKDDSEDQLKLSNDKSLALAISNCTFNNRFGIAERSAMDTLTKVIVDKIPATQVIVCLGTHSYLNTFFLLVITDERDKTPENEILDKIENSCKPYAHVCVLTHKSGTFIQSINNQSRFFLNAYTRAKVCYLSDDMDLPKIIIPREVDLKPEIERYWNRWGVQGKDFLDTALHAYDEGNYNITVFLLHQAAESTLSAIIRVVLGYRLTIHNILKLIKMTLLFTDDIIDIFDRKLDGDNQLFGLLQNGYSQSRYKDNFNPAPSMVKELADRVCKLYITIEGLYESAMKVVNGIEV